jgi:hypothetical protein
MFRGVGVTADLAFHTGFVFARVDLDAEKKKRPSCVAVAKLDPIMTKLSLAKAIS